MPDTAFKFYIGDVSLKSEATESDEKYVVEGYISTETLDRVNDIVTREAMEDMCAQIKNKNIKLDFEHEAWLKSPNIIPIGRIIDAHVDEKGLYVKAILNHHNSRFQEIWGSLKAGFLDAFSIAYRPIAAIKKQIGDKMVRVLNKVELLNVAITGNPANPDACIEAVAMKSLESLTDVEQTPVLETKSNEVDNMTEENTQPAADPTPAPVDHAPEIKSLQDEVDTLKQALAEMKNLHEQAEAKNAEFKSVITQVAELKAKLEAAEQALAKPQLKAHNDPMPTAAPEKKLNPLQYI